MKKCISVLLAVLLLMAAVTDCTAEDRAVIYKDFAVFIDLYGSSGGVYADNVLKDLPFQLPEEGEVIMIRFAKSGTAITPEESREVVDTLRLYNRSTDRFLKPVAINNTENPSSYFELFFYENGAVQWENYSVFCEEKEYTIEQLSKMSYNKFNRDASDLKPVRNQDEDGPLPTMPPEGEVLEAVRPEYKTLAEALVTKVDQRELTILKGDPKYGRKIAVTVFSTENVTWKSTLDPESEIRELLPRDRLADSWDETDTMILIRKKNVLVGHYGITVPGYRTDAVVTVIDLKNEAMYAPYTAISSDPPEKIQSQYNFGSREGKYEYEKVIEQISEQLGR